MRYGYARVSTVGQETDGHGIEAQMRQLQDMGAEHVFSDICTGATTNRPQLQAMLKILQPGDTVLVTKMDRLGRSVNAVNQIIDDMLEKDITVTVGDLGTLDATPTGNLIRTILLAIAQFERDMIRQRTQEGREIARQKAGYREGRKPKFKQAQLEHAMELLKNHSYTQVSKLTGISKSTLLRYKNKKRAET